MPDGRWLLLGETRPVRRVTRGAWPLLQATAAATTAWIIAKHVVDHTDPFFAPIAALVALNTEVGERGLNALRLLRGVIVGIVVGELVLATLGDGYGSLALAVFVAGTAANALGGERLVLAQAAVAAILTIATGDPDVGYERLADALIGAGVALVFSQLLFSPEPLALLRRAESAALREMSRALGSTAHAIDRDDDELAEEAIEALRNLRDGLTELARTRTASAHVARRTLVWRRRFAPVVRESENAGYLDLLGVSCLALARTAVATDAEGRSSLASPLATLADVLADLAEDPASRTRRERAVERVLAELDRLARGVGGRDALGPALAGIRMVALDLLIFAGVDAGEAAAAVKADPADLDVPEAAVAATPLSRAREWVGRAAQRVLGRRSGSRTAD